MLFNLFAQVYLNFRLTFSVVPELFSYFVRMKILNFGRKEQVYSVLKESFPSKIVINLYTFYFIINAVEWLSMYLLCVRIVIPCLFGNIEYPRSD